MKYIKKIIPFLLIFCLIFSTDIFAAFSTLVTVDKNYLLPEGVARYNLNNFPLNRTLYEEKKIIVYGTHADVKKNDFKKSWL